MKKTIYFSLITIGIALIIVGSFFVDNRKIKTPKLSVKEQQEIEIINKDLDNLIKDLIARDSRPDELKQKYETTEINVGGAPFNYTNILRFGLDIDSREDLKECQSIAAATYDSVYKQYMDNFDYKIDIDLANKAINLKIKAMFFESYTTELSMITDGLLDMSRTEMEEYFAMRCEVFKKIQPFMSRYNNEKYSSSARIKYQIINDKLRLSNYDDLQNMLVNKGEPDSKKEKSREEFIKQISDKIKKEEK